MSTEGKNADKKENKNTKSTICCYIPVGIGIIVDIIISWWLEINCLQEFIAISPLLLFIFMISVLCFWLRNYDFSKALSENWPSPDDKNDPPKSASRLIAFFSGLTAIIIAISVTSAYLYKVLIVKDTSDLQLDQFARFIASLGIGIIPYITNKVVTGKKNEKRDC